eukprot:scaffold12086_cov49-Attheya_sp.AAC.3
MSGQEIAARLMRTEWYRGVVGVRAGQAGGFTCATIMGVCCSSQRAGLVVIVVVAGQVAVLWLSASYDRVVVVVWEGSFPPWAAAAAARRLTGLQSMNIGFGK